MSEPVDFDVDPDVVKDLEDASDMIRAAVRLYAKHVGGLTEALVAQIAEDTIDEDRKNKAQSSFLLAETNLVQ
jgi:Arc/MetJ-type ribon-helix-helix transcriptional regulator